MYKIGTLDDQRKRMRLHRTTCRLRKLRLAALAVLVYWVFQCLPASQQGVARAEEPADAFLTKLRKFNYHDTAIEYLEWAEASPLIDENWRFRIPYYLGVSLIENSVGKPVEAAVAATGEAERLLSEFATAHPELAEARISGFWLGRILANQARRELETVTPEMTGPAKRKIRGPAAEKFVQAQEEFSKASSFFEEELSAMKKLRTSQLDGARRDRFRAYYLESKLNRALIDYELAETVATNKVEYKKQLKVAKASLGEFAVAQSKRLAGVQAKIYLGQCYEDLDEIEDALAIYQEVLNEPALPELISSQALLRSMACSADKKNNPAEAVETGLSWIRVRSTDPASPIGQTVRLEIVRQIQAALPSADEGQQKRFKSEARDLLTDAARVGGSGKTEALQMMTNFGFDGSGGAVSSNGSASSFTAAKAAAEVLRSELQPLLNVERLLLENLERSSDPENRAEIEVQLAESRAELNSKRDQAIAAYRRALELANESDDEDEVNNARYLCCYLYYTAESFHEAAILGEYVRAMPRTHPTASHPQVSGWLRT